MRSRSPRSWGRTDAIMAPSIGEITVRPPERAEGSTPSSASSASVSRSSVCVLIAVPANSLSLYPNGACWQISPLLEQHQDCSVADGGNGYLRSDACVLAIPDRAPLH